MWKDSTTFPGDQRGKSVPPNKTPENKVKEVQEHIKKFPAYESHYARAHTSKLYLQAGLTTKKMYRLYKQEVEEPVSFRIYKQIFKKTGLKFKTPQLDRCHKCDLYAAQLKYEQDAEIVKQTELLRDEHHKDSNCAYVSKARDKKIAKESAGTRILGTFDLQQCLATPYLNTSVTFYKRQLWTYNLTVNNHTEKTTTCFMWHEAEAKRGGNEIASCLHKFTRGLDPKIEHATFYSDCCGGQNRNKMVAAMFSISVAEHGSLKSIDHKFLVPGHTHMECDADHSTIEKTKKGSGLEIHDPNDWYDLVSNCRPDNPMRVVTMTQQDFYNFDELYKSPLIFRQNNTNNERFMWNQVKWIRYEKDLGLLKYKNSLSENDEFLILDIRRRNDVSDIEIPLCYDKPNPISLKKKADLISILNLLRPEVRPFYENLQCDENSSGASFDPDLDELAEREAEAGISDRIMPKRRGRPPKRMAINPAEESEPGPSSSVLPQKRSKKNSAVAAKKAVPSNTVNDVLPRRSERPRRNIRVINYEES